jgi:membrane associated rhomboid family serine protease
MRAINAGDRRPPELPETFSGKPLAASPLGVLNLAHWPSHCVIKPAMLAGVSPSLFAYFPGAVQQGEWWRVLTHPFVHVSWYHLRLCVAAFFMAYV